MCGFEGRASGANPAAMLTVMQMFKETAQEATAFTRQMKTAMAAEQAVTPVSGGGVGAESFFYRSKGDTATGPMFWYAHSDRVVLSGMLIGGGASRDGKTEGSMIASLATTALAASIKPSAAIKAAECAFFDRQLVSKLLPGKALKIQQFGDDSCMANNESNAVVMFTRVNARDAISLSQIRESQLQDRCKNERLAALGDGAFVKYACADGAPRATVIFTKGLSSYEFSLMPKKEPTAQQRVDLIATAARAYALK